MQTNELLLSKIVEMAEERVLLKHDIDVAQQKVVELADNNDREFILNSQIESENEGLKEDIVCLQVDLDEAKKEIESLGLKIQKLLTPLNKKSPKK